MENLGLISGNPLRAPCIYIRHMPGNLYVPSLGNGFRRIFRCAFQLTIRRWISWPRSLGYGPRSALQVPLKALPFYAYQMKYHW